MRQRKPNPHNTPFIVTPEEEREFLDKLQARDESAGAALERYYALDEWNGQEHARARRRHNAAMGVYRP